MFDLNGKVFKPLTNSENGEVGGGVLFYYFQKNFLIWADYSGGEIVKGHLLGKVVDEKSINFVYHHINKNNQIKNGKCVSTIKLNENGLIELDKKWQWLCGDMSKGVSKLIELKDKK